MATKSRNLGIRLDSTLSGRLEACESNTGLEGVSLTRKTLEGALDYYEQHGELTFPLSVVPTSYLRKLEQLASMVQDHQGTLSKTDLKSIMATASLLTDGSESYSSGTAPPAKKRAAS